MTQSTTSVAKTLRRKLGKSQVSVAPESILVYGRDATKEIGYPSAVVFPENCADVVNIVKFALQNRIPLCPRGAGTGMSGGAIPSLGGIVLSFEKMNKIITLNPEKRIAIVEPGVITFKLQEKAAEYGLFYPPDPSSNKTCTIGGNIAENAGGLRCLKYGVTADYLLGTEFVDWEGEIVQTGYFAEYPSTFDLTTLLCGSEGTLGVIAKIALKLIPAPTAFITLSLEFPSGIDAVQTVKEMLDAGLCPCILEYIDRQTLKAITKFIELAISPKTQALLLIEYDEDANKNRELAEITSSISKKHNAIILKTAESPEERDLLWRLRRSISPSLTRLASGKINEDVAVPRGCLEKLINFIDKLSQEINLPIPIYGHAGDGNLHVNFIFERNDPTQVESAYQGVEKVFKEVIRLGGSISGEHGIGLSKKNYLPLQLSLENFVFQRKVKKCFDPYDILNPGKMF